MASTESSSLCAAPTDAATRVLLVEDDEAFASEFIAALATTEDLQLAGHAVTLAAGAAQLAQRPAVLVVDLGLPDGNGVDLIRQARRELPECLILVSTVFGDEAHVVRSLEAGARGYLLKDSSRSRMLDDIRSMLDGGSPISPLIARHLLRRFQPPTAQAGREDGTDVHDEQRPRCPSASSRCWN